MSLTIDTYTYHRDDPNRAVVHLTATGEFNAVTTPSFSDALAKVKDLGHPRIMLTLDTNEKLGNSALLALVDLQKWALTQSEAGLPTQVILTELTSAATTSLELAELIGLFTISHTAADALTILSHIVSSVPAQPITN